MNKYTQLKKSTIVFAAVRSAIVMVFAGGYIASSSYLSSTDTQKSDAERALSQDNGRIADLNSQLEKSSIAEKRFLETQGHRTNENYESDSDALKAWIKQAIATYRLSSSAKLSLTQDKLADIKELNGTTYEARERPDMKLEFSAITDTHSISFLEDLETNAPGFVVITRYTMKRMADIDRNVITLLHGGSVPFLVETHMTFNWVGLHDKNAKKDQPDAANTSAAPTPAGGK